jgi:hypothetical protein
LYYIAGGNKVNKLGPAGKQQVTAIAPKPTKSVGAKPTMASGATSNAA